MISVLYFLYLGHAMEGILWYAQSQLSGIRTPSATAALAMAAVSRIRCECEYKLQNAKYKGCQLCKL